MIGPALAMIGKMFLVIGGVFGAIAAVFGIAFVITVAISSALDLKMGDEDIVMIVSFIPTLLLVGGVLYLIGGAL